MEANQPAVSKTLQALGERGAVTMETAADDARRRTVRLAPAGAELLRDAIRVMAPETTVALAGLDDRRLADLTGLLGEVHARLDDARHPTGPVAPRD